MILKLRDIVGDLKEGDFFWIKVPVIGIGDQDVPIEDRHFNNGEANVVSSMLGADCYGEAKVVLGEDPFKETQIKKIPDEKALGKVEAYENILFNKKITIE